MNRGQAGVRMVSTPAKYQDSWLSYCGAVAGVIHALSPPCDAVEVGGYSGYAFLVCVTEGWIDPSSPSLHSGTVDRTIGPVINLWASFDRGSERLGVKIERYWDPDQFGQWGKPLPAEEVRRAWELFERIKMEIDRNHPVVLWGLAAPEYGIVNGYTENEYLVSTYRSVLGKAETPIRFDSLQAKGGLDAIFIHKDKPGERCEADRNAIQHAISMVEGSPNIFEFTTPGHPIRQKQRYVTGPDAYREWAVVLEEGVPGTVFYEYNSYVAAFLHEAKGISARFLRRLANAYIDRPQGPTLVKAAMLYRESEAQLKQFTLLFPYGERGSMTAELCWEGAGILRGLKQIELAALEHLRNACEEWD